MSKSDDVELGDIADVPDAVPLMNIVTVDDIAVELRHKEPEDDPIYNEPKRGEKHYLQALIERIFLYDDSDNVALAVAHLRREILLSDSKTLDAEDEGGISTFAILEDLNDEAQREYKEPMCIFERLLWILIRKQYKDKQPTDVVELVLVKSAKKYESYKNMRVLDLLKQYDQMLERSVKYLQWQIFSGKAEQYIVESQSKKKSLSIASNSEINDQNVEVQNEEEKLFWKNLDAAINTPEHLDELFEAVFPSGSIELLKYLLKEIDSRKIREHLVCPILVNAVYWSIYVKDKKLKDFYKCFDCALEVEKKYLDQKDKRYGDTALHIANDFQQKYMINKLLKNHPSIAIKNNRGNFPISNIAKHDFKRFLDSLITDAPKRFLNSLDVWKIIKGIYISEYNLENVIFIDLNTFISTNTVDNSKEFHDLELIAEIKDSKELWELIDHPVISTLLELHWIKFKHRIIFDQFFAILLTFTFLIIFFIFDNIALTKFNFNHSIFFVITIFVILLELLNNYQIFVRLFKIIYRFINFISKKLVRVTNATVNFSRKCLMSKKKVIVNVKRNDEVDDIDNSNAKNDDEEPRSVTKKQSFPVYGTVSSIFLKLPLLVLLCMFGYWDCSNDLQQCKQITGIGIIFLSLNVSLLIGYFSRRLAIDLIMLLYVASTGLKFIFSTFLILLGFALSLTTIINDYGVESSEDQLYTIKQCAEINDGVIEEQNNSISKYSVYGLGVFKTIIMSTGEYEAGSLKFPYFTSYLVFVCFVFTIPIVFINLLNALAIEDVQKIKKEAMIWYRKFQIMVLFEFEILNKSIFRSARIWGDKSQKNATKIFPDMIGENAFIGIRTTTREVISMQDVDDHTKIGYLTEDVIQNALRELK